MDFSLVVRFLIVGVYRYCKLIKIILGSYWIDFGLYDIKLEVFFV